MFSSRPKKNCSAEWSKLKPHSKKRSGKWRWRTPAYLPKNRHASRQTYPGDPHEPERRIGVDDRGCPGSSSQRSGIVAERLLR